MSTTTLTITMTPDGRPAIRLVIDGPPPTTLDTVTVAEFAQGLTEPSVFTEDFEEHAAQAMAVGNDEDEEPYDRTRDYTWGSDEPEVDYSQDEPEEEDTDTWKVAITADVSGMTGSSPAIASMAWNLLRPLAEEWGASIALIDVEGGQVIVRGTLPKRVTGLRGVHLAEAISNEVSDLPLPWGGTLSDLKVEVE